MKKNDQLKNKEYKSAFEVIKKVFMLNIDKQVGKCTSQMYYVFKCIISYVDTEKIYTEIYTYL